jgi:hypothetical protein
MTTWARVRDDLAQKNYRIYEHREGTYYSHEDLGEVLVHSYRDDGTVGVVTERDFLIFENIDLDFRQGT